MKLEFVALKWSKTEKFYEYLLGSKFMVFMDNNPLGHLTSAKLRATEQHWAAQLSAFDFNIKYCSGKSNKNADALSQQDPPEPSVLDGVVPGTAVPETLWQLAGLACVVTTLPGHTVSELGSLQADDPVIQEVLRFWRHGICPVLLRQWDRLLE